MKRTAFLIPVLSGLALLARAGDATPEELVKKLADEKYEVREQATKDLIAMGDAAAPALEKALQSDDLEVRLRAGRALRAIRGGDGGKSDEAGPTTPGNPDPGAPRAARSNVRSVQVQSAEGKVKVRVSTVEDGKETVKEYEGESIEQLKKDHPELEGVLGNFRVETRRSPGLRPFDMDEFWRSSLDEEDQDLFREMDRLRRQMIEEFLGRRGGAPGRARDATALRSQLGIVAERPEPALDDQLDLRGRGLVVREVAEGTLAARLGLRRFDILVDLNGHEISGREDVARALEGRKDADKATAIVIRKAKRETLATPE